MQRCQWLKRLLVAQIEFTEWMPDGHLRHSSLSFRSPAKTDQEGDLKVMAEDGSMKNENTGSQVVYGHKMRNEWSTSILDQVPKNEHTF